MGDAREESFYSDLSDLLNEYAEDNGYDDVRVTTLPRQTDGGNPDFRIWNGVNEVTGYIEATLLRRRLWILLSGSCGVEEDKGTASAVPDTDDSTRCVWVGIGRSGPVGAGSLA